ncbi:MFS transporter [Streptomyces sp. SLBN-31]|uniref:MFS transporter n=1 Tax=Streptomyces sp. SLBN-31 TaxID=2768444 RepID=UPI00114DA7C6|nr:MFS transporter [Streptomyces sp. SLBN-31]TQJ88057.1 hypothetical protein FBY22_6915 [Streptomyces sp. SLBN-31]
MFAPRTIAWPLVALFTAGYLAPYLLPTTVGRLDSGLPLTTTQAGALGSALLLSSASAGFVLASRVERIGARTLARIGLTLAVLGYGTAALTGSVPAVVVGALIGGIGSGTATTVAATGIAAQLDPHRTTTLGLLGVSALAGAVYLTVPQLGPGHGQPLAAIALTALAVWPLTGRLPVRTAAAHSPLAGTRLPHRRSGTVLAAAMLCWSLAQNALWGVSGRIGLAQAHLTEATVGAVFAVALGAGLLGVLSYVIGLAASLDPRGRWAVLVGSASSLGTAAGPLTGSVLAERAGFPAMGAVLAVGLLAITVPMTLVALGAGRRSLPVVEIPVETVRAYDTTAAA